MIEVDTLSYEYPTTRALDRVSLTVRPGTVAALVGPNGAGKTTLLRCLAALAPPYAGAARIAGIDTLEHPREVHRRLGYLQDFFGLYDELTVRQCLSYAARARGVSGGEAPRAAFETARMVGLDDRVEQRAGELSRGLRQRLAIGQSIVHRPEVLLLDEPAAGLDPESRAELSRLILELKAKGITIMVSSHILAELEDYSDVMFILDGGRLVGEGPVGHGAMPCAKLRVALASADEGLTAILGAEPHVSEVSGDAIVARLSFAGNEADRARLLASLVARGLPVVEFVEERTSMEDVYLERVRGARRP
ncbi:MAG: ABC transporter ATP-binding protein [Alphaproteobacteria bacterium]